MGSVGDVSALFVVATLRCVCLVFRFLFSGFRRQRFGTFCGYGLAWLGHESCCCSAFSEALLRHLFGSVSPGGLLLFGFFEGAPQAPFWLGFAWWLFLSNAFRRQRFESFFGCGFAVLGHESCCCSACSKALPRCLFGSVLPGGLRRSLLLFGCFEGPFWLGFVGLFLFNAFRRQRFAIVAVRLFRRTFLVGFCLVAVSF